MRDSGGLIDHVFWRLAQLLTLLFTAACAAAFLMLRYWNEHMRRTS